MTLFVAGGISAQDIHFSQFFNSPLNTNPGLTGIFNGDVRFGIHFRNQWHGVPVDYLTFSGFADKKFLGKNPDNGFFSAGILLNYDRSGDSRMQMMQGALSGSFTYPLNQKNFLTLGAQVGVQNNSLDFSRDLRWDSQFSAMRGLYDADLPTNEPQDKSSNTTLDVGAGINYRWQKSKRTKIDLGVGAFHLNQPEQNFYSNASVALPMRLSANISTQFQLSDLMDLQIHGLAQFQDEYREYVPALLLSFYINQKKGKEFRFDIGGIGRLNENEIDAIAPMVAFEWKNWYLGINYDANISEFDVATDRNGGPEVHLRHTITTVKPLKNFKNCPLF